MHSSFTLSVLLVLLSLSGCRAVEAVDQSPLEREAEQLLVDYIRIDTANPPGRASEGARFLQGVLAREGIDSRLLGDAPHQSLYARLDSGAEAPALVLLHHIDVVPANPAEWSVPPFEGRRAEGYLWGRGALDDKSLGIAHLLAFLDLRRRPVQLERDVIFLAVADEEVGGARGVGQILERHPELFADAGFVLNEGGANQTVVDRVRTWGIEIDQKVPFWLRLTMRQPGGHGSLPVEGGGSAERLVRALVPLLEAPRELAITPSVREYFAAAGRGAPGLRGRILRDPDAFLASDQIRELSPGTVALLENTVALTVLRAGSSVNVVPASASAEIDVRLRPGTDPALHLAGIRELAGPDAEVEVLLAGVPAPPSPADTPLFRLLARTAEASDPGSRAIPLVIAGTTDSRFFRARGIPAYGFSPFKINYYDGSRTHGIDERIRLRFFAEGVALMREIVRAAVTAPDL